jgi:hypothetical protein
MKSSYCVFTLLSRAGWISFLGLGCFCASAWGQEMSPTEISPPPQPAGILKVLNGDELPFTFTELASGMFRGKPSWASGDIRIPAHAVDFFEISAEPIPPSFQTTHVFRLSNGSEIEGRVVDGAEQLLQIETTWGQNIRIRPDMLLAMDRVPPAEALNVRGALPLSQWTSDASSPILPHMLPREFRGRGIRMSTGNGLWKEIGDLPERFVVELRLGGGAQNQFTVTFDTVEKNKNNRFAGLMISLTQSMVFVRGKNKNSSQQIPGLKADSNHFRFYVDRKEQKFQMEANGLLQDALQMPLVELEGSVRLSMRSQTNDILVEKIRMEAWDGLYSLEMPAKPLPPGQVRIRLNNGDILDAEWVSQDPQQTRIKRANGEELTLPLGLVREIRSSPESLKRPRRNPRDVFVFLHAFEMPVIVELTSLNLEFLEGKSEAVEEILQIPLSHIQRIAFNPYRQKYGEDSGMPMAWPSLWDK